jgi:hypothetical protein
MPNKYWTSSWRGCGPNSKPGNAWFLESFFKFVDKNSVNTVSGEKWLEAEYITIFSDLESTTKLVVKLGYTLA